MIIETKELTGIIIKVLEKGIPYAYKWWKKHKGKAFQVLINGKERFVRVDPIKETKGYFLKMVDLETNEKFTCPLFEIRQVKEVAKEDAKKIIGKKIDIHKAISFIKKLTTSEGGVFSHSSHSTPLPSPSAQSLLALYRLDELFGDIISLDELYLRAGWILSLENFSDWEKHNLNCFALSTCVHALGVIHDGILDEEIRNKIRLFVIEGSKKILPEFNEEERGWSWCKEATPTYPFYTFHALQALAKAKEFVEGGFKNEIETKTIESMESFKHYLKTGKDAGQQSMCLWGLYLFANETINDEKYLKNIHKGIERMDAMPMHTQPEEFYIQFFMPKTVIPMNLVAPDSLYTIDATKKVLNWIKANQNEGWPWESIGEDATWATAKVFMVITELAKNPRALQNIFSNLS